MLLVAEDGRSRVKGFALLLHFADVGFCFLDYSSAALRRTGGGIGGALRLPTLVVQEGGYRTRTLGVNARSFFVGLAAG